MKKTIFVLAAAMLVFSSCGTTVRRVNPSSQTDLSGYWNDTDVRIVCNALVSDCLGSARVEQAILSKRGTPVVLVGVFRNESDEQINTEIISSIMEAAIFNSGRLDFVSGGDTRNQIRAERLDQQSYASEATAAALGKEIGADFLMTGTVRTIVDREGNQTVRTYFVTAELTDIETNQRIWMNVNSDIKKVITRPANRL